MSKVDLREVNWSEVSLEISSIRNEARRTVMLLKMLPEFQSRVATDSHNAALGLEASISKKCDKLDALLGVKTQ